MPAQPWQRPGRMLVLGLLSLGAGVRALRFGAPSLPWDEPVLAVPALQILAGHFPANAGPEYFGAAPSYALAAWFAVAGTSTLVNDAFTYMISLLILWTGWLVLRRFLDRPAALLGLAVLAVPPVYLAQWTFTTSGTHPALLILGNLCLLATHTVLVADPGRRRALFVLGVLAGFGWWLNPLIAVYLAPFAILGLRTGLLWQPRLGWLVAGAVLGGLPAWLYELSYFPSARLALHQAGGVDVLPFAERLATVVRDFIPTLLGPRARMELPWRQAFVLMAGSLWALALARAVIRDRAEIAWTFGRRGRIGRGLVILWIAAATNLALLLATHRSIGAYYLLPLCSVLPCWMGEALDWLRRRRPVLAGAALVGLLALHGAASWQDSFGSTPASARRWGAMSQRSEPLVQWLADHGARAAYMTDVPGLAADGATYLAGGRVVFADLWREHILAHGRQVDAAPSPPVLVADPAASRLRAGFQALDLEVHDTSLGAVRVLEPRPRFATTFVALPRNGWTITASHRAEQARDLLDGDVATTWDTGGPQTPGQWLAVDLGAPALLARVDLLALDWQHLPAGFRVELSLDGQHWDPVAAVPDYWGPLFFSEHHAFLKVRRGRVQAIFPPVRARHLRILQTAAGARSWAARELFAYGPGGPRPPVPKPGELATALRREGIRFVYANHWLSAWVRVDTRDGIGALDANINVNDYSRTEPDPTELFPLRLEPGHGLLLGADADADSVRALLAGQPVAVRERQAGPYRLLALDPTPARRRLDKRGWRAGASDNAAQAARVIDGDRRTQWIAAGPASTVTLDVGAPAVLRGVEVRPGIPGRDLRLAASLDGAAWTDLSPVAWAGALYWTGAELLKNGGPRWAVAFPPTRLRYLRLSPSAPLAQPWAIAEIEALE